MPLILTRNDYLPDETLPLRVIRREPQPPFNRHTHEFSELVLILSGTATHLVDGAQFCIGAGDVFVLARGDEHEFVDLNDLNLINVLFDPRILASIYDGTDDLPGLRALFQLEPSLRRTKALGSHLHLSAQASRTAQVLIRRIESELESRQPGFGRLCQAIFLEIAILLARAYNELPSPDARELLRVARAIQYMETHLTEPIRVEELAKTTMMSLRNFQRVFRDVIGTRPSDYLIDLRIVHACTLLEIGNKNITEIAFECGFNDSNYFSRLFKLKRNVTPLEYRKRSQGPG